MNRAENYRGFLLYLLREVIPKSNFESSGPHNPDFFELGKLDGKGLYFLFWSTHNNADDIDVQTEIYPLYVGVTGRTFQQRFEEHESKKDGVVYKIKKREWPNADEPIQSDLRMVVAYVVEMPLPVAKCFESMFLSLFDFAMNVQENGEERQGIQITETQTVQDGYSKFKEKYDEIKPYFTHANVAITDNNFNETYIQH
jgi:hypothetical protein